MNDPQTALPGTRSGWRRRRERSSTSAGEGMTPGQAMRVWLRENRHSAFEIYLKNLISDAQWEILFQAAIAADPVRKQLKIALREIAEGAHTYDQLGHKDDNRFADIKTHAEIALTAAEEEAS